MKKDVVLVTGFTPFMELGPEGDTSLAPNISGEMARIIRDSDEIRESIATMCSASVLDVRIVDVNGEWKGNKGFQEMCRDIRNRGNKLTGIFGLGAGYNGMREGHPLPVLHQGILVEGVARNRFEAPRMGVNEGQKIDRRAAFAFDRHVDHRHYKQLESAVAQTGNEKIKFHGRGLDEVGAGTDMCNFTLWQINSALSTFGSGLRRGAFIHANCIMSAEWRDRLIATPKLANDLRRCMDQSRKDGNPPLDSNEIDQFTAMSAILSPEEAVDLFQTFLREYAAAIRIV